MYYRINKRKGNKIIMTLAENYFDELEYYNSVDQKI